MSKLTTWLSRLIVLVLIIFIANEGKSQKTEFSGGRKLTIKQAYELAIQNFPMIKEKDLITKTREYTVSNAARGYLPALNINGQATYQSDVTNIPLKIPGLVIPPFSKDQ